MGIMCEDMDFKSEILRLENELEETKRQNIKAAELGLSIMAEKEELDKKCKDYENLIEQTQKELTNSHEALKRNQLDQLNHLPKHLHESDEDEPHKSLDQKRSAADHIALQIEKELNRIKNERDRLEKENCDMVKLIETFTEDNKARECERERTFNKMRELEKRENKMLADLSELEDENLNLQKQVVTFRMNQMESDTLKLEIQNLKEQKFLQIQKMDDLECVKNMLKNQLEEVGQVLEREKLTSRTLKQELERFNMLKHFDRLGSSSSRNDKTKKMKDGGGGRNSRTKEKKLARNDTNDMAAASEYGELLAMSSNTHFLNQILNGRPKDDFLNGDSFLQGEEDDPVTSLICDLDLNLNARDVEFEDEDELNKGSDLFSEMETVANDKIQAELELVKRERDNLFEEIENLRKSQLQVQSSKKALIDLETRYVEQQKQMAQVNRLLNQINSQLLNKWMSSLRAILINASDVAPPPPQQPNNFPNDLEPPYIEDYEDEVSQSSPHLICDILDFKKDCEVLDRLWDETIARILPPNDNTNQVQSADRVEIAELTKNAGLNLLNRQQSVHSDEGDAKRSSNSDENKDDVLLKEIQKLKAIITNKRSKNAHYRQVLASYKSTAESCFSRMQAKYCEERKVVTDTLTRYRSELGVYKEDCLTLGATLSNLRQELSEGHQKIDSLEHKCRFLESERKTLNGMLKTAIQQKFALIQKVESLECFNFFGSTADNILDAAGGDDDNEKQYENNQFESHNHIPKDTTKINKISGPKSTNALGLTTTNTATSSANLNSFRTRLSNLTGKHYYFNNMPQILDDMAASNHPTTHKSLTAETITRPPRRSRKLERKDANDKLSAEVAFKQPISSKSSAFLNKSLTSNKEKQQLLAQMFLKPHLTSHHQTT